MKKLVIVGLLAVGCFLAGCGTTRTATTAAGGNWAVTLQGPPANETLFNFVTSAESDPTATANVTFTVKGNGNLLTLKGTATGVTNTVAQTTTWNAVTGGWTLTGSSSCTGSGQAPYAGSFTMCPGSTTCTTT